jgi:hypothetical protein
MLSAIPTGQFIGGTIEHVLILLAGAYLVFLWPKRVGRQVTTGKISQEAGDAKLKKIRPWFGWFLIAWSVLGFISDCLCISREATH